MRPTDGVSIYLRINAILAHTAVLNEDVYLQSSNYVIPLEVLAQKNVQYYSGAEALFRNNCLPGITGAKLNTTQRSTDVVVSNW